MERLCLSENCNRPRKNGRYCYRCVHRNLKKKDPVKYAYNSLKSNCRRRALAFERRNGKKSPKYEMSITLDAFRRFCKKTNLLVGRGITKHSYSIDRIDINRGYHMDNIQVISNIDNVTKYLSYDWYLDEGRYHKINNFKIDGKKTEAPF